MVPLLLQGVLLFELASIETFSWTYHAIPLGKLDAPAGFRAETVSYKEGIVTTLTYPDGSRIVLQRGGMHAAPMLYVLESKEEDVTKTTRKGHCRNNGLTWAEVNFKRGTHSKGKAKFPQFFPPNIAYSNVPKSRTQQFDHALSSFRYKQ